MNIRQYLTEVSYFQEDKEMQEIMNHHIFDEIYAHGTMDLEKRELITLAVMAAKDGKELIKDHVLVLLQLGTDMEVIKEAVYQAIPYAGLLSVNDALNYIHEVGKEEMINTSTASMSVVNEQTRFEKGFEKQCSVFGRDNIQAGHDNAFQDLKHIQNHLSAHCFGDFYTRKGLDMKTRELLTFCVIASLGGCEKQLHAHTKANLAAGNTRQDLIEAITQCQPYIGYPRTLNAIAIINEVTK
ncbi:carboxymuconolactone decarboxylase family protein [[Eubacterium] hominis]|uniref:carboxymuconolactone decarboxylase family protein n=1 Tax=[Eubacterium] hominis TaxID=2764325 RepID=UPI003A4D682E